MMVSWKCYSYGVLTFALLVLSAWSSVSLAQSCGAASGQTYTSVSNIVLSQLCSAGNRVSNNPNDLCVAGTAISSVNDINLQWNALSWYCQSSSSSMNCGPWPSAWTQYSRVACAATYAPGGQSSSVVTGSCGPAAFQLYPYNQSSYIGLQCSAGTSNNTNFPGPGLTESWICLGTGGWANSIPCTASRDSFAGTMINGACGINNGQTFAYTATNWLGTNQVAFCASGNADPSISTLVSSFPLPGTQTTWSCLGSDQWSTSDDIGCIARRTALSPVGICGPSAQWASFLSLSASSTGLCLDSTLTWFMMSPMTTSLYTARYDRSCYGTDTLQAPVACYAYQTPTPIAGMCNPGYNGQSVSYSQIYNATLCTQWNQIPIMISPTPNSGTQWTWTCQGIGGAQSASCSANAVTDGICMSYTTPQTQQPTNLCISGVPTAVIGSSGSYTRTCNGNNGGVASNLCTAACLNGQCGTIINTGSNNNNNNTGTYITGMNGQTTPVSLNQQCTDPDGCTCYNVTIVNGSICLPNTLTGVTDSIRTPIDVGEVCTDADGCICNSSNVILNGTVCQTDGLTGVIPGSADLVISQAVTSGTIGRRTMIDITLTYYNIGPNIATGTKVEYYLSPLIKSIKTSAPYTIVQNTSSGYIQSSDYQSSVLVFPVGDVAAGENGQITISLALNAKLTDKEVINATSIASRLRDPKPLNNAQKLTLWLDDQTATVFGVYLVNPLIGIQRMLGQYDSMNKRLRIDPVFQDIQRGYDDYMHVMTAVRNGIFEWYKFTYSRQFLADKCTSRIEAVNVIARMMYAAWSRDVYVSRQNGTAYVDLNDITRESQNFVNRAHERGLIRLLQPKQIRGSYYLEPHKNISQWQIKDMFYLIYQRYGFDPSVMNGLLTDEESCVTRGELAYLVAHVMRNNPNILMWYNDEFLSTVVTKTNMLSIAERRIQIQRMIDKLQITDPAILFANGYDGESLVGILEAAIAGKSYNPSVDVSSTSNFLYQKR